MNARQHIMLLITLIFLTFPNISHAQPRLSPSEVLAQFSTEPTVSEVQQAALRYAGLARSELDAWSSRARWSNAVPQIQGQIAWLDQRDIQLRYRENYKTDDEGFTIADPNQSNLADDARFRTLYSIRASLDLGGLIYDRSEPIIAREVRSRLNSRDDILRRATELYFARRKQQAIRFLTALSDWDRHLELELEIQSLTAQIDAMTGGWFARQLKQESPESLSRTSSSRRPQDGDGT